jgi:radical SAM superfamily enzyme YgiQ (UPF0313 family)
MRVVLVRPPFVDERFGPPIGLAYISNSLKEAGHQANIYDINLDVKSEIDIKMDNYNRDFVLPKDHPAIEYASKNIENYCDRILSFGPDVVGIHLSYPTVSFGNKIAKRISKYVNCICGGPQTRYQYNELLNTGYYKAVVVGYGEEAILEAIETSGIIGKPLIRNKEYLPDFTDIKIDRYKGILPVVTTRGCPHRCNFCTQDYPYFFHPIDSIVKQFKEIPDIKKVMYNDSNINVNPKRTEKLFSKLSKTGRRPFGHIFGMQIKAGYNRYISKMAEAGVREVRLGIESGSVRERRSMNKIEFSNNLAISFIKHLSFNKILAIIQFIFCYPDQTEKDRRDTLDLIDKINNECDTDYIKHVFNKFVVHIGTEKYFKKEYGVTTISPQHWENSFYTPNRIKSRAEKFKKVLPKNSIVYL